MLWFSTHGELLNDIYQSSGRKKKESISVRIAVSILSKLLMQHLPCYCNKLVIGSYKCDFVVVE